MNRVIKFRGICKMSGEMVYGDLIHGVGRKKDIIFILPLIVNLAKIKYCDPLDGIEIVPGTEGQFTGLHDKNGKEIYEWDICQDLLTKMIYVVKYGRCIKYAFNGWYVENEILGYVASINGDYDTDKNSQIEIIGNIHQKPELL